MTLRRAFALPMVILLTLVAMLALGVILQRTGASSASINLQVRNYRQHHRNAGMQELVDRWLITIHGSMRDQIESDGQAFSLEYPGGIRTNVSVSDGQGALLDDPRGIYGTEAEYNAIAVDTIKRLLGPDRAADAPDYFRKVGPAKISINSAPREVVHAMALAIVPGREGERIAAELLSRRDRALLSQADIRSIALSQGAPAQEASAFDLMFTAEPTVWFVEAVTISRGNILDHSGGLIEILSDAGGASTTGLGSRSRFLTWDDIPPR